MYASLFTAFLLSKNYVSVLFCNLNSTLSIQKVASYMFSLSFLCVSLCVSLCVCAYLCVPKFCISLLWQDSLCFVLPFPSIAEGKCNVNLVFLFLNSCFIILSLNWVWYLWVFCPSLNWMMNSILTDYIWFLTLFVMLISFFLVIYAHYLSSAYFIVLYIIILKYLIILWMDS